MGSKHSTAGWMVLKAEGLSRDCWLLVAAEVSFLLPDGR